MSGHISPILDDALNAKGLAMLLLLAEAKQHVQNAAQTIMNLTNVILLHSAQTAKVITLLTHGHVPSGKKKVIAITVKEKISFYEARKRLSLLPKLSYANVVHQGAAPHRPREPTGSPSSSPAVAPPAPMVAAASAAPSLSKAPEIPVSQGLKTTRPSRPEARASASTLRSSSASAMEVDTKTPVSLTPKDQRSLERTKRDKLPVTAPKKDR